MAKRSAQQQLIFDRLAEPIAALGVDLIDVVTTREKEKKFLRLIIDKRGGVSIDDCVAVNDLADPIVSDELGIDDHDYFEVQSPGIDRPLTETADLLRHLGADVDVKLYQAKDGKKIIEGILEDADETCITLRLADGDALQITRKDAATVRRAIRF